MSSGYKYTNLLLLSLLLFTTRAFSFSPSIDWKTLSTENFHIHFSQKNEHIARKVATIAELHHADMTRRLDWVPRQPTHIVLSNESDFANGLASFFPFNEIVLYLTPPSGVSSINDYDNWLNLLFKHEYTHTLHLDKADSIPKALRSLFGRIPWFFPNAIQPLWFIEGLATYEETDFDIGVGRGQNAYFKMVMREELKNGLKPVDQINWRVRNWPGSYIPYAYGVYFMRFINEVYGEQALKKWLDTYSDNIVPARINTSAKLATGKKLDTLWDEFEVWLRQMLNQPNTISQGIPLVEGMKVTDNGYRTHSLDVGSDGSLYYVRQDQLLHTALMKRTSESRHVFLQEITNDAVIDVDANGQVLIAQVDLCDNFSAYTDLFVYSQTHGLRRLTHCARYTRARWQPTSDAIAAVHVDKGQSSLRLLTREGNLLDTLWQGERDEVLGDFDWSPDGRRIVASIWRPMVGWNIEVLILESKQWQPVTRSPLIENSPRYSADGRFIYFSAEYGDTYNIWRYDTLSEESSLLTNVATGAFTPVPGRGDTLFYLGYQDNGFDAYEIEPAVLLSLDSLPSAALMPIYDDPAYEGGQVEPYSPWSSLRPRWWSPLIIANESDKLIGLVTGGNDALHFHEYTLSLQWDVEEENLLGNVFYRYLVSDWLVLNAFISSSQNKTVDAANSDLVSRIRRDDQIQWVADVPLLGAASSWQFSAGVATNYSSDRFVADGVERVPTTRDNVLQFDVLFDNADVQSRSIHPASGRRVRLTAENTGVFDSDFSGQVFTLDWQEFVRLGDSQNVLAFHYLEAYGTDTPASFFLGGSDDPVALINRRDYALPGYNAGTPGLVGRRMRRIGAEWNFPITTVEQGIMVPPVAIDRLFGRAYIQNGAAWQDSAPDETFTSIGVEAFVDLGLIYSGYLQLRIGVAKGLDGQYGDDVSYISIISGF